VNSDCGAKALAFGRIQVNALVRMVTAAAGMVEVGWESVLSEKEILHLDVG
jgi:hypothetical protein